MLGMTYTEIFVTHINDRISEFLTASGIKYTHINESELNSHRKQFSWVVAGEEYFTFADTEDQQRENLELAGSLAKNAVITTLLVYIIVMTVRFF
jgi:hypothetical protein